MVRGAMMNVSEQQAYNRLDRKIKQLGDQNAALLAQFYKLREQRQQPHAGNYAGV